MDVLGIARRRACKLWLGIGVCVLLVAGAVFALGLRDSLSPQHDAELVQRVRSTLLEDAFELRASLVRAVRPGVTRTRKLAKDERVLLALDEMDRSALGGIANSVVTRATALDTVAFYGPDGAILAINTLYADGTEVEKARVDRVLARDFTERPIIRSCLRDMRREESIEFQLACDITPAYFDSSGLAVAISVPIFRGDQRIGVVSARLRFDRLAKILEDSSAWSEHRAWFVSDRAEFFDESIRAGKATLPFQEQVLKPAVEALHASSDGNAFYEIGRKSGRPVWLALARVQGFDLLSGGGVNVLTSAGDDWVTGLARRVARVRLFETLSYALLLALLGVACLGFACRARQRAALRAALADAQSASRQKSQFVASVSHEIRTPMTAILGYADLILEGGFSAEEHRRAMETIRDNGKHLLAILGDILDLSKLEAGHLEIEATPTDVVAMARDVVRLLEGRAAQQDTRLSVVLESPIPREFCVDATRLRQVLFNVVGNAIKFTAKGRIVLRLRTEVDRAQLVIRVEDTGIGLTPEAAAEVFEPYRQAQSNTSAIFGGTGLGLPISRLLMRRMGGDLAFVEVEKPGSRLEISLPMLEAHEDRYEAGPVSADDSSVSAPAEQAAVKRRYSRIDGLRILAADDGPDNRTLIRHILERAGAEIVLVENGALAVEAFDAAVHRFDLVLLDMRMPIMDGYEAARRIRSRDSKVPIVALTANVLSSDRERCLAAGCSAYATKPIRRSSFLSMLKHVAENVENLAEV